MTATQWPTHMSRRASLATIPHELRNLDAAPLDPKFRRELLRQLQHHLSCTVPAPIIHHEHLVAALLDTRRHLILVNIALLEVLHAVAQHESYPLAFVVGWHHHRQRQSCGRGGQRREGEGCGG